MTPQIKQRIEQIRRGEVPEGYKKTKVGLVPEEWEIKKLSDISDEIKEVAGTGKYETLSISAGIGFVNQANKFGKELSGKQYEKYTVLRKGDFAYNKGNSKKYPQGCVYRLKDRDSAAVPNVFECFRIKEGNKTYIEQVFISGFLNRQLSKKINHGVRDDGLLNLTGEDFYKSYIIIPPLPEQEKIVEILQAQDKVIEFQQKKIDELKRLKKGYLSKMFPKKGCNVPEIRFPGFTDPWEQRKLGEISDSYSGGTPPVGIKEYYGGQIPFIRSAEINSEITELFITEDGLKNSSARIVDIGDILYALYGATSGEVGRARLKGAINQAILSIKPHTGYDSEYLAQWLRKSKQSIIETYLQGGQGNLSGAIVKELSVDFPSLKEQQAVGAYFRQLDNLITLHQRKCEEQKKYKKALMQILLTGIVRVTL